MNFSVPATSANLGPGFDCLGISLGFRNYFRIEEAKEQSVIISGEGKTNPHFTQNNTFVKIFMYTYKKLGGKSQFNFTFQNNIPVARGMGSSSAIVVGAIFSAFKMMGKIPNKDELLNLALQHENHPDNITPATVGGFNASFLKKNQNNHSSVVYLRQDMPKSLKAVMVIPYQPMSTKKARNVLPKTYSAKDCVFNLSHASVLSLAFGMQRWDLLRESSLDRMHEQVRMATFPILFQIQKYALQNGALMSTLSGSGSSIFNMCYKDDAKQLTKQLIARFSKFRILTLDFDNDGVKIEKG